MLLTEATIKAAACPSDKRRIKLTDGGGLHLEVRPSGAKAWKVKFVLAGAEQQLHLGTWPGMTLKVARESRDEARATLAGGGDPVQDRRDAIAAQERMRAGSFETVAREWHKQWAAARRSQSHVTDVLQRLEKDAFPRIGRRRINKVTAGDVTGVVQAIGNRGALELARRMLGNVQQVMRYAQARDMLTHNPIAGLRPSDVLESLKHRKVKHFARVPESELPALLRKLHAYPGNPWTRAALHLVLLTGLRSQEVLGLRWDEIDFKRKVVTIPESRTKMHRQFVQPLSSQALEWLESLKEIRGPGALCFPGERDHEKPLSSGALLMAWRRIGVGGRQTTHGTRGLLSTWAHEHRIAPPDVIELTLAHVEEAKGNKVAQAYNDAQHVEARRKLLQTWGDYLDRLRRGGRVLPFRASRS